MGVFRSRCFAGGSSEIALFTNAPSPYAVIAQGDLETLELSTEVANRLIDNKPSLAVEIGQVIDRRRKALREAGYARAIGH